VEFYVVSFLAFEAVDFATSDGAQYLSGSYTFYIINYNIAQRSAWFGHVHCMPENSMVKKVYEWSPALTRSLGRPKNRWEDDVKSDIIRMKITNWKDCIGNRIKWKKLDEKAKTSLKL
jgi:hypothetical protein